MKEKVLEYLQQRAGEFRADAEVHKQAAAEASKDSEAKAHMIGALVAAQAANFAEELAEKFSRMHDK